MGITLGWTAAIAVGNSQYRDISMENIAHEQPRANSFIIIIIVIVVIIVITAQITDIMRGRDAGTAVG